MEINALLEALCQPGTRTGVGVWLMPRAYLGQEADIAVRLNIQAIDARQEFLQRLPQGACFSGLTRPDGHHRLIEVLNMLAQSTRMHQCLLVHTLDLLLLGLEVNDREQFWLGVFEGFPYPRTKLILAIPEAAHEIFPFDLQRSYAARVAEGNLE